MEYVAVIIAGGKGTRLSRYTQEIPKPMIPVNGKPVLEYQIKFLADSGIKKIYITVGHLKESIIEYFKDGALYGAEIEYVEEDIPLGTCGVFYYLKNRIHTPVVIVYGDIMFNVCLERMIQFHENHQAVITLAAHPNSHPYDSDLVVCDEQDRVLRFDKKENAEKRTYYHNLVNAGLFCVDSSIFGSFTRAEKKDFEKDLLASLILEGNVYAYRTAEYIKDMGTYERLEEVDRYVREGWLEERNLSHKQKCVFLDRDGTLNKLKGLISSCEQLELETGAADAVRLWNQKGYLCIIITNQPVIARNLCTIEELERINMKLETLLGQSGAYIDDIYYCPHHPDSGYPEERREYKIACSCRKPGTALIEKAKAKYNIDMEKSYFIGDSTVDIQTGKNAGLKTVLLRTGEGGNDKKYTVLPDMIFDNLLQAAEEIVNGVHR